MASGIPAALRSADIARYAQRAGQVEKAKPVIAYWCNYWIVNQLISRGLHSVDEECTRYTTELMDKLEKAKAEHSDDDTVMDDVAAQVYVEQFALETFQRAENAMRANKATRQTADTLAAAAVFLELRQIWEPLDPETSSKVKYAKYHALRIAKAIKAGEDPNMTNPAPRPDPIEASSLNSHDIDPSPLEGRSPPAAAYQPTVEEVSDEHNSPRTYEAQDSAAAQPQYPSRAPPVSPRPDQVAFAPPETAPTINETENYYYSPPAPDVSPLQSPDRGRNGSIGGGYFPRTPDAGGQASMTNGHPDGLDLSASPGLPDTSFIPHPNALSPSAPPAPSAQSFRSFPPPGIGQDTMSTSANPAVPLDSQRASIASAQPSRFPQPPPPFGMPQPSITPMHQATPTSFPASGQQSHTSNVVIDEEALAKAQKHARWAISALNFEDVNTAIKELRGALESLGAR